MSPVEEEAAPQEVDPREKGVSAEGRRHLSTIERRRLKKVGASCHADEEKGEVSGTKIKAAGGADAKSTGRAVYYATNCLAYCKGKNWRLKLCKVKVGTDGDFALVGVHKR